MSVRVSRALLSLIVCACAASVAQSAVHIVTVVGLTYSPSVVNAQPGDIVRFNANFGFHPTRSGAPCAADNLYFNFTSGMTADFTVPANAPAQIQYHCGVHCASNMRGVINVSQPPVTGACCVGNSCTVVTSTACGTASGAFQGSSTVCQGWPSNPITCCTANFNQISGVSVQDIFDFFEAWSMQAGMAGHGMSADINADHSVTVQDVFDFLTLWQAGCV
jgi:plastocyanin